MNKKQRFISALPRWGLMAFVATFASFAMAGESITFTAGSPGGGYFKASAALGEYIKSDIPGTSVTVIPGGGWAKRREIGSSIETGGYRRARERTR